MKPTQIQQAAIDIMRVHKGTLTRVSPGFWFAGEMAEEQLWFSDVTADALVIMGVAECASRKIPGTSIRVTEIKLTPEAMAGKVCGFAYDDGNIGGPYSCELIAGHTGTHQDGNAEYGGTGSGPAKISIGPDHWAALVKERLLKIAACREEILSAFVAKYGYQPEEAVQVFGHDGSWRVMHKKDVPKYQKELADIYLGT